MGARPAKWLHAEERRPPSATCNKDLGPAAVCNKGNFRAEGRWTWGLRCVGCRLLRWVVRMGFVGFGRVERG